MIKLDKKEYKLKLIDMDTEAEILDRITKEGETPLPSTMLWVVRNTVDIEEKDISELGWVNIGKLAVKVLEILNTGKKK